MRQLVVLSLLLAASCGADRPEPQCGPVLSETRPGYTLTAKYMIVPGFPVFEPATPPPDEVPASQSVAVLINGAMHAADSADCQPINLEGVSLWLGYERSNWVPRIEVWLNGVPTGEIGYGGGDTIGEQIGPNSGYWMPGSTPLHLEKDKLIPFQVVCTNWNEAPPGAALYIEWGGYASCSAEGTGSYPVYGHPLYHSVHSPK